MKLLYAFVIILVFLLLTWEQRKLGYIVSINSGYNGDSTLTKGIYELTRIETISYETIDYNRVGYTNEKPDDVYKLNEGDILYSNINSISHIGKIAKFDGKKELYHGINLLRLKPNNEIYSDFLLYLLSTSYAKIWAKSRANLAVNQASINKTTLSTMEICICDKVEQKKIGYFLTCIDNLLTLHQRKLENLQMLKKSLLQQMFV